MIPFWNGFSSYFVCIRMSWKSAKSSSTENDLPGRGFFHEMTWKQISSYFLCVLFFYREENSLKPVRQQRSFLAGDSGNPGMYFYTHILGRVLMCCVYILYRYRKLWWFWSPEQSKTAAKDGQKCFEISNKAGSKRLRWMVTQTFLFLSSFATFSPLDLPGVKLILCLLHSPAFIHPSESVCRPSGSAFRDLVCLRDAFRPAVHRWRLTFAVTNWPDLTLFLAPLSSSR